MFTEATAAVSGTGPQMGLLGLNTVYIYSTYIYSLGWVYFGLEQSGSGLSTFASHPTKGPRFRLLQC